MTDNERFICLLFFMDWGCYSSLGDGGEDGGGDGV